MSQAAVRLHRVVQALQASEDEIRSRLADVEASPIPIPKFDEDEALRAVGRAKALDVADGTNTAPTVQKAFADQRAARDAAREAEADRLKSAARLRADADATKAERIEAFRLLTDQIAADARDDMAASAARYPASLAGFTRHVVELAALEQLATGPGGPWHRTASALAVLRDKPTQDEVRTAAHAIRQTMIGEGAA